MSSALDEAIRAAEADPEDWAARDRAFALAERAGFRESALVVLLRRLGVFPPKVGDFAWLLRRLNLTHRIELSKDYRRGRLVTSRRLVFLLRYRGGGLGEKRYQSMKKVADRANLSLDTIRVYRDALITNDKAIPDSAAIDLYRALRANRRREDSAIRRALDGAA